MSDKGNGLIFLQFKQYDIQHTKCDWNHYFFGGVEGILLSFLLNLPSSTDMVLLTLGVGGVVGITCSPGIGINCC